jgi:pimeloyl-ACP methyl ester carboxylesterase
MPSWRGCATCGGTQAFCDELLEEVAPSLLESEEDRRWNANWCRVGASPASAYVQNRVFAETDLSDVLPAVRVPALVLYRPSSYYEPYTREVAQLISGAKLVSLRHRGVGHLPLAGDPGRDRALRARAAGARIF